MKELEVNTFSEIEELKLRVYNRTVILSNLTKDFGKEAGQEYFCLLYTSDAADE